MVDENVQNAFLFDLNGNQLELIRMSGNIFSLTGVAQGAYTLQVTTEKGIFFSKIIRL
jgi:hypothetical protein